MFSASKSGQYPGYLISRSVRLRSSASAYLTRTMTTPTSATKWSWSGWVKRGTLPAAGSAIFAGFGAAANQDCYITFGGSSMGGSADQIGLFSPPAGNNISIFSSAVYRDPSAWYHVVVSVDTTQGTAANRVRIYVNGTEITYSGTPTYPTASQALNINSARAHYISGNSNAVGYFDGYLTEINFIDGQALTPSSFGVTNAYGVWSPIKYNGTYGTNGFYLNFSDNSGATATTIGKDSSGNGNNWTPNNISVTAGVTYDSMLDVPTPWGDGGNGRGNYAVLNPLISSTYQTLTNGNLTSKSNTSADSGAAYSTFSTGTTGKWYMEFVADTSTTTGYPIVGTTLVTSNLGNANGVAGLPGQNGGGSCGYRSNGQKYISGVSSSYGNSFATNDVIGVAVDCDNGAVYFSKNGTWQNSGDPTSGATKTGAANTWTGGSTAFYIGVAGYTSGNGAQANFGQRPFSYTPPSGFLALNTQNLPTPTIANGANYFAATTYTGTGASRSVDNTVNNVSFQPDFVWVKGRSGATDHALYDAVRGVQLQLESNTTTVETTETTGLTAFNSNGFTVGALAQMNTNTATYVAWQWKEGATQGFDIVTYTGNGAANRTVSQALGVTPSMVIVRNRTSVQNWRVWHQSLGGSTSYLGLNQTAAVATSSTVFNGFSSTTFTVGTDPSTNENASNFVAYCFSEVAGFSRFGSYTGNGSADGPFVFTGFRPRWIMWKRTDVANDWVINDTSRDTYNAMQLNLLPNLSQAESTAVHMDALSNGFKIRASTADVNANGGTYIYAAFAENPFKYSLAR